jgi:predicted transcriptional regulator
MKSILIELDDEVAARLEQVAPGRSRRRSEFIRTAIQQALWHLDEGATAEAYRRQPDSPDAYVSSEVWEPAVVQKKPRARRR